MRFRQAEAVDLEAAAVPIGQCRTLYCNSAYTSLVGTFIGQHMRQAESVMLIAEADSGGVSGVARLNPSSSSISAAHVYLLNGSFVIQPHRGQDFACLLVKPAQQFLPKTSDESSISHQPRFSLIRGLFWLTFGIWLGVCVHNGSGFLLVRLFVWGDYESQQS